MCHHQGFSTPHISDHVAMLDAHRVAACPQIEDSSFRNALQANQRFGWNRAVVGGLSIRYPLVAVAAN
jgi:hypothetical protein